MLITRKEMEEMVFEAQKLIVRASRALPRRGWVLSQRQGTQ